MVARAGGKGDENVLKLVVMAAQLYEYVQTHTQNVNILDASNVLIPFQTTTFPKCPPSTCLLSPQPLHGFLSYCCRTLT